MNIWMRDIPTVLSSQEMLDKAFRRVKKVMVTDLKGFRRAKAEAFGKINALANTLAAQLNKYVRAFPSIDQLHPFHRELIDVVVGVDELRHSLGALDWARKTINHVKRKEQVNIKTAGGKDEVRAAQNSVFGRVSSVMDKISGELDFLRDARDLLRHIPDIRPEEPMVVIAGAPNVGKSQIVSMISSGKPEIASYPFTTKDISIGHMMVGNLKVQVMDTPGLLDRPLEERNPIELQAIAALEHLDGIFIFVFDASESCGYSLPTQRNLLENLKTRFPGKEFILVNNKSDLRQSDIGMQVSAKDHVGLDTLITGVEEALNR